MKAETGNAYIMGMSGGAADVKNLLPLSGSAVDIGLGQRSTLTLCCWKRKQYGS